MHIGLIPDGNRRYMKKKGILNLAKSYKMGVKRFYDFLEWSMDLGANEVTIYALSSENIENRDKLEIKTLFTVFSKQAQDALKDPRIHKNRVHIKVCGNLDYLKDKAGDSRLSKKLLENLSKLEEVTKDYDGTTLNLAIAYGGRQEILNAAQKVSEQGLPFTEDNFRRNLWVKDDPDIIIRTAEDRLSNFLTWQSAYSEIYFPEKLWQEFTKEDLSEIVKDYKDRERRFGK